jgi:hypothetical protein
MVTNAECEMMGRALCYPFFKKGADIRLKESSRIGIAGGRYGAVLAFAFCKNEFEPTVRCQADAENRNRTFFDLEFNACTGSRFAVIFG